jgi:deoxycytidylate deaminase
MGATLEKKILVQSYLIAPLLNTGRCRHLSFLTYRNKIISIGRNSYLKTHPLGKKFNTASSSTHSELSAIINFPHRSLDIRAATMYNVRIDRWGKVALSAPCPSCQNLIRSFRIKKCFYSTQTGFAPFAL